MRPRCSRQLAGGRAHDVASIGWRNKLYRCVSNLTRAARGSPACMWIFHLWDPSANTRYGTSDEKLRLAGTTSNIRSNSACSRFATLFNCSTHQGGRAAGAMGGESIRWAPGSPPWRLWQPLLPRLNCPNQGAVSFSNSCGLVQVAWACSSNVNVRCGSGCRKWFC